MAAQFCGAGLSVVRALRTGSKSAGAESVELHEKPKQNKLVELIDEQTETSTNQRTTAELTDFHDADHSWSDSDDASSADSSDTESVGEGTPQRIKTMRTIPPPTSFLSTSSLQRRLRAFDPSEHIGPQDLERFYDSVHGSLSDDLSSDEDDISPDSSSECSSDCSLETLPTAGRTNAQCELPDAWQYLSKKDICQLRMDAAFVELAGETLDRIEANMPTRSDSK